MELKALNVSSGTLYSKNKVSKLPLGAVLVPGKPPGAILEPPGSILGAILAHVYSFFDVFRVCFGLRFSCVFKLYFSPFFFIVPPLFRSARKGPTCE